MFSHGVTDPDKAAAASDLSSVMTEVVELMHARGAMLTVHAPTQQPPRVLYVDPRIRDEWGDAMLAICKAVRPDFEEGYAFWRAGPAGTNTAVMLFPIEQVPGHSRLLISILFDNPSAQVRKAAEELYRSRRPFAVGFFQLWQLNRIKSRRLQAVEIMLDHVDFAIILVDRSAKIVFANRAAEEMMATGDALRSVNDTLRATYPSADANLRAALMSAITGEGRSGDARNGPLLAFRRESGAPLVASIIAADSEPMEPNDVAATIYILDPCADMTESVTPLCQMYGMSKAETNIVLLLVAGETIEDIARSIGIREPTARNHLKTALLKTNTESERELVTLVLSSLIPLK